MPEMNFHIRWPDGTEEVCYSPSLIIKDYFEVGKSYPPSDFLERARTALLIASDRVKAKYGMPCSRALAQLARIEKATSAIPLDSKGFVTVDAFRE
jgi:uncharacterized repeat protein (TIGR04042 family)